MKRRLLIGLAAGALVAALAPGVASAESNGKPYQDGFKPGCNVPVGAYISLQAKEPGSNAGPNRTSHPWTNANAYYVPEGVPNAPGQNVHWRCVVNEAPAP